MASGVAFAHRIEPMLQNYRPPVHNHPAPPDSPILPPETREALASYGDISGFALPLQESAVTYIKSEPSPSPSPEPINPQMFKQATESAAGESLGPRQRNPSRKAKENAAILEIFRRKRLERVQKRVAKVKPHGYRKAKSAASQDYRQELSEELAGHISTSLNHVQELQEGFVR
jgi:hypothetical protein